MATSVIPKKMTSELPTILELSENNHSNPFKVQVMSDFRRYQMIGLFVFAYRADHRSFRPTRCVSRPPPQITIIVECLTVDGSGCAS